MISNTISLFLSVGIIFIYFLFLDGLCSKPKILSKISERIVVSRSNFTVLCEGDEPLTWSWPRIKHEEYTKWTKVNVHEEINEKRTHKYLNRIFLRNVTYLYTGFYTCHPKRIQFPEKDQSDSIYLYVHDDYHSFVNEETLIIAVTQYDKAIIPCRPTSPDIPVTLQTLHGNDVYPSVEENKNLVFDPRYGFILLDTSEIKRYRLLCRFSKLNTGDYVDVFFNVEPTDFLEKPEIEFVSGVQNLVIGDSLILKCKMNTTRNVSLTWITPPKINVPDRIQISEQELKLWDNVVLRELKIDKVAVEDSGVYYCFATDDKNHTNSTSSNLTVYNSLADLIKHQANVSHEDNNAQEVFRLPTTELQVDNMQKRVPEFYILEDDYSLFNLTDFEKYLPSSATPVLDITFHNYNIFLVVYFYIVSFVIVMY